MRTRSLAKIAVVGIAGVLALSACSNSKTNNGGLAGNSSGGSSAPAGGGTYTIAFEGPLSGDNQQLGINEVNAAELAIKQANAKGDLGFTLKLLKADDVGDPSKAPAAAAQVLQDNTVMGVIGPSFSGATKAVGQTYGDAGLAMITPSASNGTLQTLGFKTFHRIIPNDNVEGTQGADWLARKGLKKVFVVDDQSDYGKGVADAVDKELKAKGVAVTRQGVDAKTTDYGAIAQSVKSSGAGALFYGGYDAQAALFAKALKAVNYTGITAGGNGVKSSVFTKGAGAAGNGWYFTCGCLDATIAANAKQFTTDYTAAYNTPPSTYSPEAFDATNALIQAIKDAKSKGSVTKATVLTAVNAIDYQGITTEVKFGSDGEPAGATTVSLYTQKNGQIVSVGLLKDQN
ncbi:branched-chain amino acid ABC transporter substrate-binding protein [Jatrophihabitans telluris]|uniref:Branched-chain amino acid ABC transporter substrate-binding protein n=1 Tax=Jatrophihabitans telluris TaxID=2038343 RepID=A0ABY4QVZ2_9ACTN|nr:branched-chain amino acid ABC transporter substrate-binding protein [Jatrophihabitans telluris]UQX87144.1 branched-chain amino acid ABC transporter substrate-binding protein [Jatrophihabitans telluris]